MDTWKAGKDVMDKMIALIGKYHPDLADISKEIAVVFREKAQQKSGRVLFAATKKAPPSLPVLTDDKYKYKFIIEIGADSWSQLDDTQQLALLDHHLCSMFVKEDDNGGVTYAIRPPDFSGFKEEFERWGLWQPLDDETLTAVEKMFGAVASTAPKRRAARKEEPVNREDDEFAEVLEALKN